MALGQLGETVLWLTLVLAVYGGLAAAGSLRWRRVALLESAGNAAGGVAALASLGVALLLYALLEHDFSLRYVAQHSSRDAPLAVTLTGLWAGQAGSLLFWAWGLALLTVVLRVAGAPAGGGAHAGRPGHPLRGADLLLPAPGHRLQPLRRGHRSTKRAGPQSGAVGRRDAHPSPPAAHRLHELQRALRPGHRGPGGGGGPPGGRLRGPAAALDAGGLDGAGGGAAGRGLVGLPRPGLGGLLGLGPGGERGPPALAHRHRLPALGDGAGAAGDAEGVEPGPGHRQLRAGRLRHLRGAQRGAQLGALLRASPRSARPSWPSWPWPWWRPCCCSCGACRRCRRRPPWRASSPARRASC